MVAGGYVRGEGRDQIREFTEVMRQYCGDYVSGNTNL